MEIIKTCLANLTMENYIKLEKHIREKMKRQDALEAEILHLLQNEPMHDFYFVFFCSALMTLFPKAIYLELLLEAILACDGYTLAQKKFLLHQINVYQFQNPAVKNERINELDQKFYASVLEDVKKGCCIQRKKREERNSENVVVLTDYFLGERHAPTHSTLERCYTLKKECGMNVYLLCNGENLLPGRVPYYEMLLPNVCGEYDGMHWYSYKGEEFLLYQAPQTLGYMERLQALISYVEEVNPYYIVYVGNRSCTADILNQLCPVVTVATIFSRLPGSGTDFAMVGRKVTQEERENCKSEIIEVPFTFELTEKKRDYTREELGIPQDGFVMVVIGNRLDSDVGDEFLEYMEQVSDGYLLFIGSFATYEEKKERFPYLKERATSLGRVSDVMGILGCADLYVNPKRQGGGFSVIEAFHAGIPAVSTKFGDVAAAAGEEFCVGDYEEMLGEIERYRTDTEYYMEKCQKAKLREAEMTNGSAVFKQGIEQMLERYEESREA